MGGGGGGEGGGLRPAPVFPKADTAQAASGPDSGKLHYYYKYTKFRAVTFFTNSMVNYDP